VFTVGPEERLLRSCDPGGSGYNRCAIFGKVVGGRVMEILGWLGKLDKRENQEIMRNHLA